MDLVEQDVDTAKALKNNVQEIGPFHMPESIKQYIGMTMAQESEKVVVTQEPSKKPDQSQNSPLTTVNQDRTKKSANIVAPQNTVKHNVNKINLLENVKLNPELLGVRENPKLICNYFVN